jgi:hypothetical protein
MGPAVATSAATLHGVEADEAMAEAEAARAAAMAGTAVADIRRAPRTSGGSAAIGGRVLLFARFVKCKDSGRAIEKVSVLKQK